jgi:hypothetical protein
LSLDLVLAHPLESGEPFLEGCVFFFLCHCRTAFVQENDSLIALPRLRWHRQHSGPQDGETLDYRIDAYRGRSTLAATSGREYASLLRPDIQCSESGRPYFERRANW